MLKNDKDFVGNLITIYADEKTLRRFLKEICNNDPTRFQLNEFIKEAGLSKSQAKAYKMLDDMPPHVYGSDAKIRPGEDRGFMPIMFSTRKSLPEEIPAAIARLYKCGVVYKYTDHPKQMTGYMNMYYNSGAPDNVYIVYSCWYPLSSAMLRSSLIPFI
jgi:hypothetical protein